MRSRPSAGRSASSPAPGRGRRRRSRGGSRTRSRAAPSPPSQILAVTFTDKAAGEMRARLEALGVRGVRARTFHSAALSQLRYFRPDAVGRILPSKALILRQIANSLPGAVPVPRRPATSRPRSSGRSNRRVPRALPDGARRPRAADPGRPDAARLPAVRGAEARRGTDRLRGPARARDRALRRRARGCRVPRALPAFTVDEYQDVNLLQQTLLERWLGPRDDLCVVGDDYQSIYAFTGATPRVPARVPERFPHAAVIRLEENYRSTPQVLELANRLVPQLGGAEKVLRPTAARRAGARGAAVRDAGGGGGVPRRADAARAGCAFEEIAILCRTNARLADFEEVLHEAGIPSQGAAFLDARGGAAACCGGSTRQARPRRCGSWRSTSAGCPDPPGQARRARGDAAERPRPARPAGRGGRRHRRRCSGPSSSAASATAARRGAASTCSPTTAPRGSSSSRAPAAARGEGAAARSRRGTAARSRRSGGSSTSG